MPYQPDQTIRIITDTSVEGAPSARDDVIEWSVIPSETNQESRGLSFIMTGSDQATCQISFSGSGENMTAVFPQSDTGRQQQVIRQPGLLIAIGSLAPCDVLPVAAVMAAETDSIVYEIKRMAGGLTFVDRFQIQRKEVSGAEASREGWVTGDAVSEKLIMITMVNMRTNALVVRQLWPSGADWWIFEETPYRQSRRVQ